MSSDLQARLQTALGSAYRFERELGGGGMSRVFVAEDLELGRKVVLKVLPPDLAAGLSIERFRREIHLAAQLQHPNVVPLHAAGVADGLLYYTMPLVEGESLRSKLAREGEQPIIETIRLLRDVADALAYAHEHGVVHRDIKPDNVLVSRHHALVTDFGVAKALNESTGGVDSHHRFTSAGVALGTPAYMAPEQAAADPHADHRTDIYALGVLGYEMLTGRPPFTGSTPQSVLAAQVTQRPEPVSSLRSSVPAALAGTIMRCLEKKPADRCQTADEVLQQLEAMTTPSGGTTPTLATRAVRQGHKKLLAVAFALLAMAAAGIALWRNRAPDSGVGNLSDSLVAVIPFRVTGAEPALAYLGDGMVDLLAARLTGEGGPRAVDPRVAISSYRRATSPHKERPGDAALTVARQLGAGRVIDGGVVGSSARLVLTASVRQVPGGVVQAQASVEGPADSLASLIDRLTGQLLLIGAGEGDRAAETFTSLPALRAFLAGQAAYREGRYEEAVNGYQRALRADSSFALAALGLIWASIWGAPNSDSETGERLAWAARDRLSPRDRTLLEAEIGPRYPAPSSRAEVLAARERAVEVVPDRADSWYQLGDWYHHHGSILGVEDPWGRAAPILHRALELDPTFTGPLVHLAERAAAQGDTAAVRRFATTATSADSVGGTAEYLRWIVALARRDTAALQHLRSRFDRMPTRPLGWMSSIWQEYGWPIDDARRATMILLKRASTPSERDLALFSLHHLAMNAGRPVEALATLPKVSEGFGVPQLPLYFQVLDAIYWQGDTAAAAEAARQLARSADVPTGVRRSIKAQQYFDICVVEQWRLGQGNTNATSRAVAKLRTAAAPPVSGEIVSFRNTCALMLQAWSATLTKEPEARMLVASLDSLLRTGPPAWSMLRYGNLLVARLYEMHGDLGRASVAVRRGSSSLDGPPAFLSAYLREQARLSALTGDRQRAIWAYQHYLALRTNPEASLKADAEDAKAELAKLLGER